MSAPDTVTAGATDEVPWWEWDLSSNRVDFSPLKVTMLGYDAAEFRGGGYQAFTELLHPEDHDRTMAAMRDYLERRVPLYQVDYRIRAVDGAYRWYADRGAAVAHDAEGRYSVLRGVVFDVGASVDARDSAVLVALRRALTLPHRGEELCDPPTVCMQCRRLKSGDDGWIALEARLAELINRPLSHGICWDCVVLLYPEVAEKLREQRGR